MKIIKKKSQIFVAPLAIPARNKTYWDCEKSHSCPSRTRPLGFPTVRPQRRIDSFGIPTRLFYDAPCSYALYAYTYTLRLNDLSVYRLQGQESRNRYAWMRNACGQWFSPSTRKSTHGTPLRARKELLTIPYFLSLFGLMGSRGNRVVDDNARCHNNPLLPECPGWMYFKTRAAMNIGQGFVFGRWLGLKYQWKNMKKALNNLKYLILGRRAIVKCWIPNLDATRNPYERGKWF